MSRRRLLYLASSFPYGKGDAFFGPEARELVRQGVDVRAVPLRPREPPTTADAGSFALRKPLVDAEIARAAAAELLRSPRTVGSAFALLFRSPAPRVLIRNLAAFPKALWIAGLARKWQADHIHAHWAGPPSTAALVASRVSGVPWSFTAHAADIAAGNLLNEKCASAVFVRFIAEAMMGLARTTAPRADRTRWVLLRLGIEVPPAPVQPAELNDPPVLLMAAHFGVEKRHRTLVAAALELARHGVEFELWLAGSGPLEDDVARQVRESGLEQRVRLLGYVPNEQILEWLAGGRIDIVVLPSDAEGLPVALIEALAHGVPTVAGDAGGVVELLGEGRGEIVPPGDVEALETALLRVLRSEELRAELRRLGRARVEQEYDVVSIVHRLVELLGFEADDAGQSDAQADHPARAAIEDDPVSDVR